MIRLTHYASAAVFHGVYLYIMTRPVFSQCCIMIFSSAQSIVA